MATMVSASVQLVDMMSAPIQHINNVLNTMLANMAQVDVTSDSAFSSSQINAMQSELAEVDVQLSQIISLTKEENDAQEKVNRTVQQGQGLFSGITGQIKAMVGAYVGIQGIRAGINFYKSAVEGADLQIEAEQKLTTVMRQRMSATQEQIDNIKQLTAQQQAVGVVGDEVQMGGAQQLATFLNTQEALSSLIPAMNNLAVQQNGVNVTSENMVSIGNMMGKVMQGQTSALTRVGITFSEAQEQAIKYGDEQERAIALAQVITDNVGEMNAAMLNTPQGQIKQVSNTWGDMKEVICMQLYPIILDVFNRINTYLPTIAPVLAGITTVIGGIITVLAVVLSCIGKIANFFSENWSIIEPIILGIAAALAVYYGWLVLTKTAELALAAVDGVLAIGKGILAAVTVVATGATWAQTVAQRGLNGAMYACPIVWIIILIIALIAIIFAVCAAIAKFTGVANSAFGVICGAVLTAGAFIFNAVIGVINSIIQFMWTYFVEPIIGIIEWVLNVMNGGFDSFGDAIKNLIGNIISWFLSLGKVVTKIIDSIFGTNWTSGLETLQNNVLEWGKNEGAITLERSSPIIDAHIDYSDAWNTGSAWGDSISTKLGGMFGGDEEKTTEDFLGEGSEQTYELENLMSGTDATAKNTKEIAENTEKANSLLELVRDNWEKEAIAKYTAETKTITYDLSGMQNTYNNTGEAFDFVKELQNYLNQKRVSSAEGI